LKRLKKEHGCESVEGAECLLEDLEAKLKKAEAKADRAAEEFELEWGEVLEGVR